MAPKRSNRLSEVTAVEVRQGQENGAECEFCGMGRETLDKDLVRSGNFYRMGAQHFHYFCVLFSTKCNLAQTGGDEQGLFGFFLGDIRRELALGAADVCAYCRAGRATVACARCKLPFHFPCGAARDCAFVFQGTYKAFCPRHRPTQSKEVVRGCTEDRVCVAGCMEEVQHSERSGIRRNRLSKVINAFPILQLPGVPLLFPHLPHILPPEHGHGIWAGALPLPRLQGRGQIYQGFYQGKQPTRNSRW